jgi:polysaccharide deacetylase 2 family uncharacterized protein YibQ
MASASKKKTSRKKKQPSRKSGPRPLARLGTRMAVWAVALGVTVLGLVGVLLVPEQGSKEQPKTRVASVQPDQPSAPAQDISRPDSGKKQDARVFEQIPPKAPESSGYPEQTPHEPSPQTLSTPPDPVSKPPSGPCLALVIDDMGQSVHTARRLLQIMGSELTWSILPYSPDTKEVVEMAAENGLEYLLHIPMEPKGYPQIDPGPGSIFVHMDPEQIRSIVANDLQQVPGAAGANNHMGSRFTEDAEGMRIVLREITSRRLFFMDSLTSPRSTVRDIARDMRMQVAFRDVFLDNTQEVEAIVRQLRKAERLAVRTGQAIAIGHPYPETLTALAKWSKEKSSNVDLVTLSRIVRNLN